MKIRTNNLTQKATRIFTDREEPRASFWKNYCTVKAELNRQSEAHVLNFYGIGGIGKSFLLKKLISEMKEQLENPLYAYIDLGLCQESRTVLDRMRNCLADNYDFEFPMFELGCYAYAKKVGEKADPLEVKQLADRSRLLKTVLSVAGNIPIADVVAKIFSLADQGVALVQTIIKKHRRELEQIKALEAEDLYKLLPYLFSLDMTQNLAAEPDEPLVVFIDTYEKLVNELSCVGEPLKFDEWIRNENGLIQNIPNVLWVIAGREKLKWDSIDKDWKDSIESHLLGNLSEADSDSFLLNAGIRDVTLRQQLYELTNGTPVYLDLCVDRFLRIEEEGQKPDISMFGKDTFDLIERFVRYMDDAQKDLVYMFACLKKWDDSLISEIAPKVLSKFSITAYEKAKDFSFVIASDDGFFNIHQTVGDVLADHCPELIKKSVGQALLDTFAETLNEQKLFSSAFSTALAYVAQAGLLMYEERDELCEFYENHLATKLFNLINAGKLEPSKAVYEILLERAEQNKTDLFYACTLFNYANLCAAAGDNKTAIETTQNCLDLFNKILGEDNNYALLAMNNLASFQNNLGYHQKALETYQSVFKKYKEAFGENHPDTILIEFNIALTYGLLGNYSTAYFLFRNSVIPKYREVYGPFHHDTFRAMNNMANFLAKSGEPQKAYELYQSLLHTCKSKLGEDHPETVRAMHNMSEALLHMGEFSKALELYQSVLQKHTAIFGEDHPQTLTILCNIATTYMVLDENDKAFEMYQTILDKYRALRMEDLPDAIRIKTNMACILTEQEEYDKALETLNSALKKSKTVFGDRHPETARIKYSMAIAYRCLEKNEEVLELYQNALEIFKSSHGENHELTTMVMLNLADYLKSLDKYEEALALYRPLLKNYSKTLGEDHPQTTKVMYVTALLYTYFEKYEEALELYEKLLKNYKIRFGENHENTIDIMSCIALVFDSLGKYKEALEFYQAIFENYRETLGKDHPETLSIMVNLAKSHEALGEKEKAEELCKEIQRLGGNAAPQN